MSKEIPTKEYMQDGWDSGPIGCHPYKRGSRHNKIGDVDYVDLLWYCNSTSASRNYSDTILSDYISDAIIWSIHICFKDG